MTYVAWVSENPKNLESLLKTAVAAMDVVEARGQELAFSQHELPTDIEIYMAGNRIDAQTVTARKMSASADAGFKH